MTAAALDADGPAEGFVGRRRWLVALVVVATMSAALFVISRPETEREPVLAPAAAFSLEAVRGDGEVSLADLRGKPVVLNFFASWCAPCRRELPALREASHRFGGQVQFVGIDHQDVRTDAVALLDEFGIRYPAGFDPKGQTAFSYGLRGLPATVFITADGRVQTVRHGELDAATLERRITALLEASPTLQRNH